MGEWSVKLLLITKQVQPFLAHYCVLCNRFSMFPFYKLPIFSVVLAFCYILRGLKLDFQYGYRASWPMVSVVIRNPYRLRFVYFTMYVNLKSHTHDSELPCHQSVNAMQLLKNLVSMAISSCAETWKSGKLDTKIQFLRYWTCIPSLQKKTAF